MFDDPSEDRVSLTEAASILEMTHEQFADFLREPDDPRAIFDMTLRHVLAVKVADALLPLVGRDIAIRTGVSAGREAQLDSHRLLVIALDRHGLPGACWREADADWRVMRPFLAVPGDLWFRALRIGLDEHRAAAPRLN
jgi:hypothetical protein